MKNFICIFVLTTLIMVMGQASATPQISVEVFNKDGTAMILSQSEVELLASVLPSVKKIIAHIKASALGGNNLYIDFQLRDGLWKNTAAQINGPAPVSHHIRELIKDELK